MAALMRPCSANLTKAVPWKQRLPIWRPVTVPQIRLIATQYPRIPLARSHFKVPRYQSSRHFHATPIAMAEATQQLKQTLTLALLQDVRNFWFDHLSGEEALIIPGQNEMMRWFKRDAEFDKACVAQFQPALEAMVASGASATEILDAVDTSSPLTWLSILILLDQVPRNCYRGDASKLVFGHFDPLAEEVALRAIDAGIPTQSSDVRYRLAYRFWFQLPLMHSENVAVHDRACKEHEETARDMEQFLRRDVTTLSEDEKKCFGVLSKQQDAFKAFLSSTYEFEKRHKVIIERFGRYPHRNQALGRQTTADEKDYLENGGETFT